LQATEVAFRVEKEGREPWSAASCTFWYFSCGQGLCHQPLRSNVGPRSRDLPPQRAAQPTRAPRPRCSQPLGGGIAPDCHSNVVPTPGNRTFIFVSDAHIRDVRIGFYSVLPRGAILLSWALCQLNYPPQTQASVSQ